MTNQHLSQSTPLSSHQRRRDLSANDLDHHETNAIQSTHQYSHNVIESNKHTLNSHSTSLRHSSFKRCFAVLLLLYALLLWTSKHAVSIFFQSSTHHINYHSTPYRGPVWRAPSTVSVRPLLSNSFLSIELHSVQSEDASRVFNDWVFINEKPQVNILVHEAATDKFVLFKQRKYAVAGETMAVLGGGIEVSDASPLDAAKRELKEELQMESDEWTHLGSWVVNCNRGEGTVDLFLARHSRVIPSLHALREGELAVDELERQHRIRLTRDQLMEALLQGEIGEVKWSATVAFALLRFQKDEKNK